MTQQEKGFSIRETINKNIEKVQLPHFNQHNSLIGWSSMNYPKVLLNPQFMPKPKPKVYDDNLDFLYQQERREQQIQLVKPFTNHQQFQQENQSNPPPGFKRTLRQVSTSKHDAKGQIYDEAFKGYEEFLNIRPLSCEFGQQNNENFTRHIRQIGEVYYNLSYENEEIRHLKKLPNSIITEQNLQEILNPQLKFLNLHNHTWINMEQISKIGYFATNIEELILSNTDIDDDILVELAKSCKHLKILDISNCSKLTERGIRNFIESMKGQMQGIKCAHNAQSATDYSLEPLHQVKQLKVLDISFCNLLTNQIIQSLIESGCRLEQLHMATIDNISGDMLAELIAKSKSQLKQLDLSLIASRDLNDNVLSAIGMCQQLQTLNLTGCQSISDHQLTRLNNLPHLKKLKLGGVVSLSDSTINQIIQGSPLLSVVSLNNCPRISETGLENILKNQQKLEVLSINFTPEVAEVFLQDKRKENPKINIIRNIVKMTDIKDDGLRMPLPLESVVMQRPKKKKKK
ncbi:hypothetical protein pb186bvf_016381 [Paramecium bursaria]